jgi:hypothetical protein
MAVKLLQNEQFYIRIQNVAIKIFFVGLGVAGIFD